MPYPIELYKGDHYRLCHSDEELKRLTVKDNWSEDRPESHAYLPFSAHSSQVELAQRQANASRQTAARAESQSELQARLEAARQVAAEIEAKLSLQGASGNSFLPPSEAKRGPGRPPNPKVE